MKIQKFQFGMILVIAMSFIAMPAHADSSQDSRCMGCHSEVDAHSTASLSVDAGSGNLLMASVPGTFGENDTGAVSASIGHLLYQHDMVISGILPVYGMRLEPSGTFSKITSYSDVAIVKPDALAKKPNYTKQPKDWGDGGTVILANLIMPVRR